MMTSTGIDYHKNYSVLVTTDAQGKVLRRGRVEHKADWSGPARREGLESILGPVLQPQLDPEQALRCLHETWRCAKTYLGMSHPL